MLLKPEWSKFENDLYTDNPEKQKIAAEAFDETRKKEMAASKKVRDWEKDRKNEWVKNKPEWKKQRLKAEQEKLTGFFKSLKQLGNFKKLKPTPGYVLVSIDQNDETQVSGILLAGASTPNNTGIIVEISSPVVIAKGKDVECPVKKGDHVLFKHGAGADAVVGSSTCRLMQFGDLLAVIEK